MAAMVTAAKLPDKMRSPGPSQYCVTYAGGMVTLLRDHGLPKGQNMVTQQRDHATPPKTDAVPSLFG